MINYITNIKPFCWRRSRLGYTLRPLNVLSAPGADIDQGSVPSLPCAPPGGHRHAGCRCGAHAYQPRVGGNLRIVAAGAVMGGVADHHARHADGPRPWRVPWPAFCGMAEPAARIHYGLNGGLRHHFRRGREIKQSRAPKLGIRWQLARRACPKPEE